MIHIYIIKCSAYSAKGNFRENNEDNYYVNGKYLPECHIDDGCNIVLKNCGEVLFAVFDGLGGEFNGKLASYTAAETMYGLRNNFSFENYFETANEKICLLRDKNLNKMIGTTVCIVYIKSGMVTIANIGDSKIFLIRENIISQLSEDHTALAYMLKSGTITKEDIEKFKFKNSLSQCLGIRKSDMIINPHIAGPEEVENNDRFLICSDGVSNSIDKSKICEIVNKYKGKNIAKYIVEQAILNGSKDNATAVSVKVCKGKD